VPTAALVLLLVVMAAPPAGGYLGFTFPVRGVQTLLRWQEAPVRWFARNLASGGVSASQLQTTVAAAFATWEAVPTSTIAFSFVGFTGASPFADDSVNVIGFESSPGDDRVLGATGFTIDTLTGAIVESDIFFNSAFTWSVSDPGDPARFDLQSVALHEIGHFLGLGHSALGETQLTGPDLRRVLASSSVMFPIAFSRGNTLDRVLQPDDVAGISSLYPTSDFARRTGSIRGRVLKAGRGVFGAHVVAFNQRTGTMTGAFSLNQSGEFELLGLSPGPHVLRVEPLDDASVESFFDSTDPVDVAFPVTYATRLVVVTAGATVDAVDVTVEAR